MSSIPIYTVGYGGRSIKTFVELLQHYEIEFLVDVRSQPYSRFNPQFSRDALEQYLKQHNIRYVFMGDTLGGRPNDDTCYVDGRVDYAKVYEKSFYQKGIGRLRTAWEKQLHVAIMCAEAKPQECHRSKLIGNTLLEQQVEIMHINENEEVRSQEEINRLLTVQHVADQLSLFDQFAQVINDEIGFSRKKYPLPGRRS